jgi:hypothetical protein
MSSDLDATWDDWTGAPPAAQAPPPGEDASSPGDEDSADVLIRITGAFGRLSVSITAATAAAHRAHGANVPQDRS